MKTTLNQMNGRFLSRAKASGAKSGFSPLRYPAAKKRQGGFNLIEMMVSVTLGLIVLIAISYIYIGNRQAYLLNEEMARLQESGRIISETLGREFRMASYRGCNSPVAELHSGVGGLNSTDLQTMFERGVLVTPKSGGGGLIPDGIEEAGFQEHEIWVFGGTGDTLNVSDEADTSGIPIVGDTIAERIEKDGITRAMIISDCDKADFFHGKVSSDFTKINFQNGTTLTDKRIYGPGATVTVLGRLDEEIVGGASYIGRRYYVRSNNDGLPPVLAYGVWNQPLADGVTAFRTCVRQWKGDKDKQTEELLRWDDANVDWKKVTSVQYDFVLASANPRILPEATPRKFFLCGDKLNGTPSVDVTDRTLRRLFTVTVALRNKIMNTVGKVDSGATTSGTP